MDSAPMSFSVGDGGASWRMKALRRAKEQADREGRQLEEVVGERWGSLADLATSLATAPSAPAPAPAHAHAHLHAIRGRKSAAQSEHPDRRSEMRRPHQETNLSWPRNKLINNTTNLSSHNNQALVSQAIARINKFDNDGSFLQKIILINMQNDHATDKSKEDLPSLDPTLEGMTANQVAAEILKLKLRGNHQEAHRLTKHMEAMAEKTQYHATSEVPREESQRQSARYSSRRHLAGEKRREDDSDRHLARKRKYCASGSIEDEYDYDGAGAGAGAAPSKKKGKRRGGDEGGEVALRTEKERCVFCFENPWRPKHLVVSIANYTYLMLPQWQPLASGHCIILPLQHEAATRNIDDKNVWEEIRNFKKCLLRMFAKQEKDVVFLETVIGLSKQHRHCMIECIPIPSHLSAAAPIYFKKAIDEAEDEWAPHDAKKLIPTSGNLRQLIPPNFAYFHVGFGLDRGFVHVIDDEANFNRGFGLNVIRGMLQLPEEDMHRKRRYQTVDKQKHAVLSFVRDWEPFDWTRQLN